MPLEADVLLVNGRMTTLAADGTPPEVDALAVRAGRVLFAGAEREANEHVTGNTTVVDLGGRRVIPGLIDSHVHFVRAGLTWNDEVRWEGVPDLATGLARIEDAARKLPADCWIRVIGGWHPGQLAERRGPTLTELDRVAPNHPVFLQCTYDWGMLNTRGMAEIDVPDGVVHGMAALRQLYWQLPVPTLEQQVASTAAASRLAGTARPGRPGHASRAATTPRALRRAAPTGGHRPRARGAPQADHL